MLAIANYGRFWRRDKIYWGGGKNNPGHLKGQSKKAKKILVDFREQIGIYVLFDEQKRPVYVGQAGIAESRLLKRLSDHKKDHLRDRWVYFSWFGLRRKNDSSAKLTDHQKPKTVIREKYLSDALHEIEAVLISVVEPTLNKRDSNWKGSDEFLQHLDDGLTEDPNDMLIYIADKLETLEKKIERLQKKKPSK
jgi:hypothetical protein